MRTIPWISHAFDDPCMSIGSGSLQYQWGVRVSDDRACWNLAGVVGVNEKISNWLADQWSPNLDTWFLT